MAKTLVESLAADWDPSKYTAEYRENLMKVIRAKLKGRKPKLEEQVEPQSAEVIDLMERLRQSLEGTKTSGKKRATGARSSSSRGKTKRARKKHAA
jgi:DNA end-binding protein Ku